MRCLAIFTAIFASVSVTSANKIVPAIVPHSRCGPSFEVAKTACGKPCKSDTQCGEEKQCYSGLGPCGGALEPLSNTLAKVMNPSTFSTSAVVGGQNTCNPPPCAVPKPLTPLVKPCTPPCAQNAQSPGGPAPIAACQPPTCGQCPAGTRNIGGSCMACSAGSYQAEKGQKQCFLCPSGTYASAQGSTNCTKCKKGTFAGSAGSVACSECAKGESAEAGAAECTKPTDKKDDKEKKDDKAKTTQAPKSATTTPAAKPTEKAYKPTEAGT